MKEHQDTMISSYIHIHAAPLLFAMRDCPYLLQLNVLPSHHRLCKGGHYTGKRPSCVACATGKFLRSPLDAQGKQNGHLGCSEVVHRRFQHHNERQWAPWSPQSFEHAQNTRRVISEVCDRSKAAQRWQKEGTRTGAGADWTHSGRSMNAMRFACQSVRCFCLSCASLLTPLDDQQCTLNVHRGERSAFIRRSCRLLSLHGDVSTSLLPRLSEAVTVVPAQIALYIPG